MEIVSSLERCISAVSVLEGGLDDECLFFGLFCSGRKGYLGLGDS